MIFTDCFSVLKIFVILFVSCMDGAMFDFHLIEDNDVNATVQEQRCKDLGYDGFAILSTPEAFFHALKLTIDIRNLNRDTFIGAHFQPVGDVSLWDDGTAPRSDSPFQGFPPAADPAKPCARLDKDGELRMANIHEPKAAMCGNHQNYPSESVGQIVEGELQTTTRKVLSNEKVVSYLECSILCGMLHYCRAAEFNSDLFSCTLIGEYSSTGTAANPKILTYIRQTF